MVATRAYTDTNVLVQFRPLTELDWCSIVVVESVELVLLPAVVRELERMKLGDNKRLRKRATSVLDMIEKLFQNSMVATLRPNVTISFGDFEPTLDFDTHGLSREIVDDWILATLIQRESIDAVLVTDDMGLLLKARNRKIRCVRPPSELRLPPEEDEEVKKLKEENRALQRQVGKRPDLSLTFADGGMVLKCAEGQALRRGGRVDMAAAKERELLAQVEQEVQREAAQRASRFPVLGAAFGAFSRPPFDKEELRLYIAKLRAYHEQNDANEALRERSFEVNLTLRNDGHAPAEGIEIQLEVPGGVVILDGRESRELLEPALPAHFRSPFDAHQDQEKMINSMVRVSVLGNSPAPRGWYFDRSTRRLRMSVDSLVHTGTRPLPRLRIAFPIVDEKPRAFEFNGSLLVSKPPEQTSAALQVVPLT